MTVYELFRTFVGHFSICLPSGQRNSFHFASGRTNAGLMLGTYFSIVNMQYLVTTELVPSGRQCHALEIRESWEWRE